MGDDYSDLKDKDVINNAENVARMANSRSCLKTGFPFRDKIVSNSIFEICLLPCCRRIFNLVIAKALFCRGIYFNLNGKNYLSKVCNVIVKNFANQSNTAFII